MTAVINDFSLFHAALEGAALSPLAVAQIAAPIQTPEERRLEWLKSRWGKFTASEFHRVMSHLEEPEPPEAPKNPETKTYRKAVEAYRKAMERHKMPDGLKSYAKEKAVELLTECEPDTYISPDMQWGIDHEHEAADEFERRTGLTVEDARHSQRFILLPDSCDIGGTPDGLIPSIRSGLELKCPTSKVHLDHMDITDGATLKAIDPKYYWQCQGLMMITSFETWHFASYDPRFKAERHRLHIAVIERHDVDIALLRARLALAVQYRDFVVAKFGVIAKAGARNQ